MGLVMAYKNFDPSFNVKFSTYAYSYILGEMKKVVNENKTIKYSKELLDKSKNKKEEKSNIVDYNQIKNKKEEKKLVDFNDKSESLENTK